MLRSLGRGPLRTCMFRHQALCIGGCVWSFACSVLLAHTPTHTGVSCKRAWSICCLGCFPLLWAAHLIQAAGHAMWQWCGLLTSGTVHLMGLLLH